MDMSFAIQALSAEWVVKHRDELSSKPGEMLHNVPGATDRRVAELKLADWGIAIDHLTKEQKEYLYGK